MSRYDASEFSKTLQDARNIMDGINQIDTDQTEEQMVQHVLEVSKREQELKDKGDENLVGVGPVEDSPQTNNSSPFLQVPRSRPGSSGSGSNSNCESGYYSGSDAPMSSKRAGKQRAKHEDGGPSSSAGEAPAPSETVTRGYKIAIDADAIRNRSYREELARHVAMEFEKKFMEELEMKAFQNYYESGKPGRADSQSAFSSSDSRCRNQTEEPVDLGKFIRAVQAEDHEAGRYDINSEHTDAQSQQRIDPRSKHADKLKALRKFENTKYDERFFGTIVNTEFIGKDYSEVHVKPAVISELQRITSLTLKHPEECSYGVLAKNKITGAILYGPPGTGKTLLAKALAKHSGYNMMALSSGDIYDPKWGEDEKYIRSTFRIAQRLHPCILFIDEADAIFGKRTAADRKHERGMLNQFLSEWDGIATGVRSPFILLATNRPHDIDEAVLRRAPVQILIDIPTRADRKSILDIYLKDEELDLDITTEKLARMTQFYTGSDLKSMCVNAALACLGSTVLSGQNANAASPTEPQAGSTTMPNSNPNPNEISQTPPTVGPPDSTLPSVARSGSAVTLNSTSDANETSNVHKTVEPPNAAVPNEPHTTSPDAGETKSIPKTDKPARRILKKEHFITAMKSIKPTGRGPTAEAARKFKQKPM